MMNIKSWRTSFGKEDIAKIEESISNGRISMGVVTEQLETQIAKMLNVPYVLVTTSGSTALLMSMIALGIGSGDEVIVPNRTWIATAHAPLILGAKVILVDVMPDLPSIDVSQIRSKITSRTKAIIPVHLNGRAVDMEKINELAREYGLKVVEDTCQSLFSKNSQGFLGTQSDIGCFSFAITKLISTGQGGAVVTKDKELYEKLKLIRWHGTTSNIDPTYTLIGSNFKFNDILASIGLVQLSKAEEKIKHMNEIYLRYAEGIKYLPYIKMIPVKVSEGEIPLYVEVLCDHRFELVEFLKSKGIQMRLFLPNVETAPYIETGGDFPNSKVFSEKGLFLPCGPAQSFENVDYVLDALKEFSSRRSSKSE